MRSNLAIADIGPLATSSCCQGRAKLWVLPVVWPTAAPPPPACADRTFNFQRLAKWFTTLSPREKAKIIKDVSQLVLARRTRMCNFLEYKGWNYCPAFQLPRLTEIGIDSKIVYRRYASLFL